MKVFSMIAKIVAALAMVAGIVYVVATYGDKIVAWAKNLLGKLNCGCCDDADCCCEEECCCEATSEDAAPAAEAEEADFEG